MFYGLDEMLNPSRTSILTIRILMNMWKGINVALIAWGKFFFDLKMYILENRKPMFGMNDILYFLLLYFTQFVQARITKRNYRNFQCKLGEMAEKIPLFGVSLFVI